MKRMYLFSLLLRILILIILLASCVSAPSNAIIQTAIAKTEMASTSTLIATATLSFTDTPAETLTPTQDTEKQELINEVIALFQIGTLDAYKKAYDDKLRLVRGANDKYWNDEEIQSLADYALGMSDILRGGNSITDFDAISPDYNGVYHEEMATEILKYITRDEWTRRYEENKPIMETVVANLRSPLPAIGMTAQQVLDSQWGQPIKVNKTISANSVSEQWVYGSGKYIYFENGIVTTIQE